MSSPSDTEILVHAEHVSKKFCRSLKRSLWYGVQDILSQLGPFARQDATPIGSSRSRRPALRENEFWAVDDVSFELRRGECLGLIGSNGAGKTTLLKLLNGLMKPDQGRITMRGRVGALIALGAGFNPILTGRENIYVNGAVLGLTRREITSKLEDIIDFAEISEFIDAPVQTYSSGMQVRLGFSVAANLIQPDVLILDEVLAVGDAAFRAKCERRLGELMKSSAVIVVSHMALHIRRLCDRVLWLDHGKEKGCGPTHVVLAEYERSLPQQQQQQKALVLSPRITSARILTFNPPTRYGSALALELEVTSTESVTVHHVVIGIAEGESAVVAQSNLEQDVEICGKTTVRIRTDPLMLRDGEYTINLALYGATYRDPILRYTGVESFALKSGLEGASSYHFGMMVSCRAGASLLA
mgnify:CR=1 FL=1